MTVAMTRHLESEFDAVEVTWDGVPLEGPFLAIDTETTAIDDRAAIPGLVLASASNGRRHVIVAADQVAGFLLAHADRLWIMFNAGFDFWVLHEHLGRQGCSDVQRLLWANAERGRLRDAMLLAQLVDIAEGAVLRPGGCSLEALANKHTKIHIDKQADEHYRMNYRQLLGRNLEEVDDAGWFVYAARDAAATVKLYAELLRRATVIGARHGVQGHLVEAWGPLTETIQVRASIALSAAERCGFGIDTPRLEQYRAELRAQVAELADQAERAIVADSNLGIDGTLFKRDRDGAIRYTDTGSLSRNNKTLQLVLLRIKDAIDPNNEITIPYQGKGKGISTGSEHWAPLASRHPFLERWLAMGAKTKLLGLLPKAAERVHPRYKVLVQTGRASCSSPNIQQVPRTGGVRELFIASPRHVLLGADYSCIEMVTLAQVCLNRYGHALSGRGRRGGRPRHQ